ncbi:MAG: outer membrane beta-barrel protein [Betaproteobacteria bacterium]
MDGSNVVITKLRTAKILALALSLLALDVSPAFGEESTGPYFTAGLGWARWHGDYPTGCEYNETGTVPELAFGTFGCTGSLNIQDTLVARIGGGWWVYPQVALELAYSNFGRISLNRVVGHTGRLPDGGFTVPLSINETGRYRLQGIDFSALGAIPLNASFSLTGRLGALAYYQTYSESGRGTHSSEHQWDASTSGVAPLFGVGALYRINPALAVHAEWDHIQRVGKVYTGFSGLGGSPGGGHFDLDVVWLTAEYALR